MPPALLAQARVQVHEVVDVVALRQQLTHLLDPSREGVIAVAKEVEDIGLERAALFLLVVAREALGLHELLEDLLAHLRHVYGAVVCLNELQELVKGFELGVRVGGMCLENTRFRAGARVDVRHVIHVRRVPVKKRV